MTSQVRSKSKYFTVLRRPVSPKNKSPAAIIFFVLKTDCGILELTWKNYLRPKNNRSLRFIFGETGLWLGDLPKWRERACFWHAICHSSVIVEDIDLKLCSDIHLSLPFNIFQLKNDFKGKKFENS